MIRVLQWKKGKDKVLLGKLLQEISYPKEKKKGILIDNLICIDILGDEFVREVKYSDKMKQADRMQILYYLYYLKKIGVERKGIINYPKMKKREIIELTEENQKDVENALLKINEILKMEKPPEPIKKKYCKKCAYFELCFS